MTSRLYPAPQQRTEPTPYQPTEDEIAALGARLFGLEEHEPSPRAPRVSDLSSISRYKETTNAKN